MEEINNTAMWRFLEIMKRRLAFPLELKNLEIALQPAYLRGESECVKCGYCCTRRTCVPFPEEMPRIAEFLDLTVEAMIKKYFVVDSKDNKTYFLRPIMKGQEEFAGSLIPASRTYDLAPCVFLDAENNCKIQPVKPRQATASGDKCMFVCEETSVDSEKKWTLEDLEHFGIDTTHIREKKG